jgi:hypothetical protein
MVVDNFERGLLPTLLPLPTGPLSLTLPNPFSSDEPTSEISVPQQTQLPTQLSTQPIPTQPSVSVPLSPIVPTVSISVTKATSSTSATQVTHATSEPVSLSTNPQSAQPSTTSASTTPQTTSTTVVVSGSSSGTVTGDLGHLSPSQSASTSILNSKGVAAGIFTVVGIVSVAVAAGIFVFLYRRRLRKKLDDEMDQAMVAPGYNIRSPIDDDGDDEHGLPRAPATAYGSYPSSWHTPPTLPMADRMPGSTATLMGPYDTKQRYDIDI